MAPSKLFTLYIFAAVTVVQSQSPTPLKVSNDCHFLVNNDYNAMITIMDSCTFPIEKINASCLSKSCPEISNETVCYNGSDNLTNLTKNLQVVQKCLQKPQICGFAINPDHIPKLKLVADQLLTGTGFTGTCWIDNNTSSIYNLNGTRLSLVQAIVSSPSPLMIQSKDDAIYNGTFSCNITNQLLNELIGPKYYVLKNISFNVLANFTSSSLEDLNGNQNPDDVKASYSKISPKVGHFNFKDKWPLFEVRYVFEQMVKNFVQKSSIAKAYGEFIAAITNNVFENGEDKCST